MECPVCYETVTGDKINVLDCAHSFCIICISKLLAPKCPLCRTPIVKPNINNWNDDSYIIDVDVVIPIRQSRPRRRRPRQDRDNQQNYTIPSIVLPGEINNNAIVLLPPPPPLLYRDDVIMQQNRSNRNSWRQNNTHNRSRWSSRGR